MRLSGKYLNKTAEFDRELFQEIMRGMYTQTHHICIYTQIYNITNVRSLSLARARARGLARSLSRALSLPPPAPPHTHTPSCRRAVAIFAERACKCYEAKML